MSNVKIVFQEPDGSFPIEGKMLTEQELETLIALMPGTKWILIMWAMPPERQEIRHSPEALDYGKLSDETLRHLANGVRLTDRDKDDIRNAST